LPGSERLRVSQPVEGGRLMSFVQIIEIRTSKADEMRTLEADWRAATEGKRTLRRSILTQDRNDAARYAIVAFFDSYESAMKNSELPETAAFSEKLAGLVDAPMVFHDLEVVEDAS
jgi:quinol monooxygenase YgiN